MSNPGQPDLSQLTPDEVVSLRRDGERFILAYRSGIDEMETKLRVLQREFTVAHSYNPIENISSRLKAMDSLMRKAQKRGCRDLADVRANITDIAGVRVIVSFATDVHRVRDLLLGQSDMMLLAERDYIAAPKPNGYRSLHLIVETPVYLSTGLERVPVEVQIRTIAMDFWASLEHKIYYKYDGVVPAELLDELTHAADTAHRLDDDMERLHRKIRALREPQESAAGTPEQEVLGFIAFLRSTNGDML